MLKPYIKDRKTFRVGVRSPLRLMCKKLVDSDGVYRRRNQIEGIFGEVKQAFGSYEKTRSYHIAELFVISWE